jgi:hypothetical protein
VALDLWDAARVKLRGDQEIDIRCVIADFGVKGGVAHTNAFVFDTAVVNIAGSGTINLKTEAMDMKLKPEPKDRGFGSLRTPLHIRGTFGQPDIGPDMGKLAARGAGTLVMGILNPLLAILPLLEEGKGKDSNCGALIAQANASSKKKPPVAVDTSAKQKPSAPSPSAAKPDSAAAGATAAQPADK